jgi:hypothetical protein
MAEGEVSDKPCRRVKHIWQAYRREGELSRSLSGGNADGWTDGQAEPGIREEERPYREHAYVPPSLPMMATCSLPVPSHHVQILNLYDTIIREQLQACQGSVQKR